MEDTLKEKMREFLYTDENVKYSFTKDGNLLTIHCNHPIFRKRFNSDTITLPLEEFVKSSSKGSPDYNFFEKFYTSIQEHFLDFDA